MSVKNFIPELWAARAMRRLEKTLVYAAGVNTDYEGEIRQAGDTVRINSVGPVTITPYVPNVDLSAPEELNDEQQVLKVDQMYAFNFKVDDVDQQMANVSLLDEGIASGVFGLANAADCFVSGLYDQAGTTTESTPVNSVNALACLLTLAQGLDEKNVPQEGRWCVIPPWLKTRLVLAKVLLENSPGNEAWTNGYVGRAAGFDLRQSNNVRLVSATNYKIMAGTRKAISFAGVLNKVEAYRPHLQFSDAVKGLYVYGGKVVYPDALAVLDATIAAEP
jgi:hypothetical protein